MLPPYHAEQPSRASIDALEGDTVLEFGANWCGICQAATPHIEAGRPLGRSFGVKLWPTLVLMRGGRELARVVRPRGVADVTRLVQAPASG
jgi:thioredoxin 1